MVSARKFEVARIFPESRRTFAAVASSSVIEKVDWKACCEVEAVSTRS